MSVWWRETAFFGHQSERCEECTCCRKRCCQPLHLRHPAVHSSGLTGSNHLRNTGSPKIIYLNSQPRAVGTRLGNSCTYLCCWQASRVIQMVRAPAEGRCWAVGPDLGAVQGRPVELLTWW